MRTDEGRADDPSAPAPEQTPEEGLAGDAQAQIRQVKRGAAGIFGGMIAGQAIRLVTALVISRGMGSAVFGAYGLLLGITRVTDIFGHTGIAQSNLRYVAQSVANYNPNGIRATARMTTLLSLGAGLVVFAALWAAAPLLVGPSIYNRPELLTPLRITSITVPVTCVMFAFLTVLQGAGRVSPVVLVGRIGVPVLALVGAAVVAFLGLGLPGIVSTNLLSAVVGLVAGGWILLRWLPAAEPGRPKGVSLRQIVSFSFTMVLLSGSHLVLAQADMLVLGHYVTKDELGYYFAAVRVAAIIAYPMSAISGAFSPAVSAMATRGDREGLRTLFAQTTRWSTGISFLALGVVAIAPKLVLRAFGPDFPAGAIPLVVLSLGQLINSGTGCNAPMLTMTGQHRLAVGTSWAAAAALVLTLPVACQHWGDAGAAWSVVAVTTLNNVVREVWIWVHLRIHPYDRRFWVYFWVTGLTVLGLAALARVDGSGVGLLTLGALVAFGCIFTLLARYGWMEGLAQGLRRRPRPRPEETDLTADE
jgi:O-antigen/teichoic acid export membrane protein